MPTEAFQALLTARGLRVTRQRLLLLRELQRRHKPATHAELTDRLAPAGLDRATIYRNLVALTDSGVLRRSELGDHVWRYELPRNSLPDHRTHPHLVCVDCGEVSCLSSEDVQLRGRARDLDIVEVQLRGRCAPCASAR